MDGFIHTKWFEFISIVVYIWAFWTGGRNIALLDGFGIPVNPSLKFRKMLHFPSEETVNVEGIIVRLAAVILGGAYLLNWLGISVFAPFGSFESIFYPIAGTLIILLFIDEIIFLFIWFFRWLVELMRR